MTPSTTAALPLWGIIAAALWMAAAGADGGRYALHVDGLACPFCAYGIEKQLRRVEGVEAIDVDVKTGRVVVTLAGGHALSEAQARKAVEDAGFTLRGFHPGDSP